MQLLGLMSIAKAIAMLTLSFFILFAVSKTESKGLKQFGRILVVTLCIISVYIVTLTVYFNLSGLGDKHEIVTRRMLHQKFKQLR